MDKVIYIPAIFAPVYKEVTKKVTTGETTKGLFGGTKEVTKKITENVEVGQSDCDIDAERLSQDISAEITKLNSEGYEVHSMITVTSGNHKHEFRADIGHGSGGYGYGYSYTKGVILLAKKK
ncbi:hypothetical protein [Mariprofundus ferrooxydans]|uniref:hypothetical protein n=1 Tax=Mariprofundus ferrooxydans TaxID=314344 RepID=UPI0006A75102|nr:hypothetical protein [Mariprofundus ferrooxydans]KON48512.1 hypothetical protein AL013_02470 [Mariprofundus ferrooxydans]